MPRESKFDLSRRGFHKRAIPAALAVVMSPAMSTIVMGDRKNSADEKSPAELITPAAQATIDKSLAYLLRNQVKSGRNRGAFGNGGYSGGVATASLAGLSMMCGGHAPGQGKFGKAIDHSIDFVLKNVRDTGYIAKSENSNENMYGHGFSMLFLSQAYGMTQKAAIGKKLRKAVELTCSTQHHTGGWP